MDLLGLLPRVKQFARGYLRRRGYAPIFLRSQVNEVWVDVGAHLGEGTLDAAIENPRLLVFAFEPNWALARRIMGVAPNFVVLPMAVSDIDGTAEFFINASDGSSSLARMEASGVAHWKDFDYTVQSKVLVPTIRIDTFMNVAGLRTIDFLKIDAEGVDLRVAQSAGSRLSDIRKIKLEVDTAPDRLYEGAPRHDAVVSFFTAHDFALTDTDTQNDERQENLTFTRRENHHS